MTTTRMRELASAIFLVLVLATPLWAQGWLSGSGVAKLVAGSGINLSPAGGTGTVTISTSGGSGTVTQVLTSSVPSWLTLTWNTDTTTPAAVLGVATGQTAHKFIGTGSGASFTPVSIVTADLPTLATSIGGLNTTTNPTLAQIPIAQGTTSYLPVTIGADATLDSIGNLIVTKTNGVAFAASATTNALNATNISSGTLNAARLPATAVQTGQANTYTTGAQDFTSATSILIPTQSAGDSSTKGASTAFVTSAIAALNPAESVTVASAAVLPNSPTYSNGASGVGATLTAGSNTTLTVDGVTSPSSVLVQNQASAFQNGIYTLTTVGSGITPWILTRRGDFNQPSNMNNSGAIPATSGTVNSGKLFVLSTTITTVGTDSLTFIAAGGGSFTNPMTTTDDVIYSSDNSGTAARKAAGKMDQRLGMDLTAGGTRLAYVDANLRPSFSVAVLRNIAQMRVDEDSGSLSTFGAQATTTTGTQATSNDSDTFWFKDTSGAVSGNIAATSWCTGYWKMHPAIFSKCKEVTTTNVRYWFALCSSSVGTAQANNDPSSNSNIGFRRVPGTDTNYQCYCSDGSASTITDSAVAGDANQHSFYWYYVSSSSVLFFIDGNKVANITTHVPSTAGFTVVPFSATTLTTSGAEIRFRSCWYERD